MAGIYAGVVTKGGVTRCYIGSTTRSFERRWSEHQRRLRLGEHHSPGLQAMADTYGLNAIHWEAIASWSPAEGRNALLEREQLYLDSYREQYGAENVVNARQRA